MSSQFLMSVKKQENIFQEILTSNKIYASVQMGNP